MSPDKKKRQIENGAHQGVVGDNLWQERSTTISTSAEINSWSHILNHTVMGKLTQSNIFICGQRGLGIETASNLISPGCIIHSCARNLNSHFSCTPICLCASNCVCPRSPAVSETLSYPRRPEDFLLIFFGKDLPSSQRRREAPFCCYCRHR